jgi:hypothetical protein
MSPHERLLVTNLITDTAADKSARRKAKTLRQERKAVEQNARRHNLAAQRAAHRAEVAASTVVPAAGERRPQALRSWLPFRVRAHRASSARLAGAYPFLTGVAPGAAGVPIGADAYSGAAASFDPWQAYADARLTNPNVLLAGVIGQGKSAMAKSLAVRSLPFGRRAYVPADVKGEWAPVARAVGGVVLRIGLGSPTRLNPLDPGPKPKGLGAGEWAQAVTTRRRQLLAAVAETTLGRGLYPAERTRSTSRSSTPASPPTRSVRPRSRKPWPRHRSNSRPGNARRSATSRPRAPTCIMACAG